MLFPFARELLGFSNLRRSHTGSFSIARCYCSVTVRFAGVGGGSKGKPCVGFDVILWDAVSLSVHEAEVVLRQGIPLGGGEAKPLQGFGVILRDAASLIVHEAEDGLRLGLPLSGTVF